MLAGLDPVAQDTLRYLVVIWPDNDGVAHRENRRSGAGV